MVSDKINTEKKNWLKMAKELESIKKNCKIMEMCRTVS